MALLPWELEAAIHHYADWSILTPRPFIISVHQCVHAVLLHVF